MIRRVVAAAPLLLLAACTLTPDYERPALDVPAEYYEPAATDPSFANVPWWELFEDEAMDALVKTALENNRDLGIAVARVNEARALLGIVRADQYPFLDVEARGGRIQESEAINPLAGGNDDDNFDATAFAFFEIDLWGKLRRATEAARAELLATEAKLDLIDRALAAGCRRIEATSFVHPGKVPQMADAEAVCAGLPQRGDVTYTGLILNWRGYERARATERLQEVGVVIPATDTFGARNQGMSVDEGAAEAAKILAHARGAGMRAQVTVSVAFGCPFEGEVELDRVIEVCKRLADEAPVELALADTIGVAVPSQVLEAFGRLREAVGEIPLRAHFHDTRNTGIANAFAALQVGVETLDASIGGIGGCPFAPDATGNIATEDLVYMLDRMRIEHGVDLGTLLEAADWLAGELGKPVPSMLSRAGGFPGG